MLVTTAFLVKFQSRVIVPKLAHEILRIFTIEGKKPYLHHLLRRTKAEVKKLVTEN
jgi:hypothetical protein